MQFDNFDIDTFLRDYWQKKPLLVRQAWREWHNPLEPDELAGLACEPEVEARLIEGSADAPKVEHGPLAEARFTKLGRKPWTLLVQAVDHHVTEVAELLEPFRFIPNWRIDDAMVSYATDGGGVGAHFDQYDVFLVQGLGRRRWRVGQRCDESSELLPHDDLRLLAHFEATDEWVLEPGDMLYVPPGIAHDGVAVGDDCMTYSIGFRAPSRADLIGHWVDDILTDMADDDRYGDPGLKRQANPGEITSEAIGTLHAMITEKLGDREAFARWFGAYNSTPKYPEIDWRPEDAVDVKALSEELARGATLARNPASRFSFIREGETVLLFVDGDSFECVGALAEFAKSLCVSDRVPVGPELARSSAVADLIVTLLGRGSIALADEV